MVKFEGSASKLKLWTKRAGMPALCLLVTFFAVITQAPVAMGQGTTEFTLNTTSLDPDAVVPGGSSATTITIDPVNSFSGTVTLGCQVTSNQTTNTAANPVCSVSPVSVTPPATATATITTSLQTTTVGYSVTITAAGPATTYSAPPLQLTVLAVTPQFTINVQNAVSPNSVPAGSGAGSRRKKLAGFFLLGLMMAALFFLPGCGGSSSPPPPPPGCSGCTPAGNYTVTVTGTDSVHANLTHDLAPPLTLTVN